ncbi:PilN domain-containing protein [Candidatus Reidiella endopervernicosa]|uniref:PilN domain-containing protein n=1 Tax=Candidatus Reidiella endopervernicosa TaxID=2738883 RepID=A0A6N0I0K2_9GAMM|nr:PilN domain-containing protein [Candidatus Reidiella endopervernicosa]
MKRQNLSINGSAESNARVSAYMRNIDSSEWIGNPRLSIITGKSSGPSRTNDFKLSASQIIKNPYGE